MAQSDRKSNRNRDLSRAEEPAEDSQGATSTTPSGRVIGVDEDESLYVGVDLGTSRSSIAASNGIRSVIPSVVGWPKDSIAKKLLKLPVLVGQDALANRLCLDLVYPLEHGVIRGSGQAKESDEAKADMERSLAAAREILMHLVKEVKPESGQMIYGVIGAPAQARKTVTSRLI